MGEIIKVSIIIVLVLVIIYFVYRNNKAKADEVIENKIEPAAEKLETFWEWLVRKIKGDKDGKL